MQMLDENHLLLKYASEDVVVLKTTESNSQPSLFVVYNIIATKVSIQCSFVYSQELVIESFFCGSVVSSICRIIIFKS